MEHKKEPSPNEQKANFRKPSNDFTEEPVGEEFDEFTNKPVIRIIQTKMHNNNLSTKSNAFMMKNSAKAGSSATKTEPEKKAVERKTTGDKNNSQQQQQQRKFEETKKIEDMNEESDMEERPRPGPPKQSPADIIQENQKNILDALEVPQIGQTENLKKEEAQASKSKEKPENNNVINPKSRYEEYERLTNNCLSNAVDVSLSMAKEEYYKSSESTFKGELQRTRKKNVELRTAIENARKEKENLAKEIEKIKSNISKSEKTREVVRFF